MSDLMEQIFEDVRAERSRQDQRWGKQMHPNGTSQKFKPMADSARNACRKADAQGANTWMHIMREEVWEALSETDRERLRSELVQVVAVGVAWIECLDEQDVNA
jgi:hypothetical protein